LGNSRDIKLSNAKGILIFLVVLGHLLEVFKDDYFHIFLIIYSFHMPLFVFISGYFAKRVTFKKIVNLILLYIIIRVLFTWFLYAIGEIDSLEYWFEMPYFHLWYIVSLVFWYFGALLLKKANFSKVTNIVILLVILMVSVASRDFTQAVVNIISVYDTDFTSYTLSYQRTLTFAPFFFAGYFLNQQLMQKIYSFLWKPKIILSVFLVFLIIYFQIDNFGLEQLFRGSWGEHTFTNDSKGYLFMIFLHYFIASVVGILILNTVNNQRNILTTWGDNSLQIFLFHPIFHYFLKYNDIINGFAWDTRFLLLIVLSLFICILFGSRLFIKFTWPICNPVRFLESILSKLKVQGR
jgi:fucose 4-O-acetylase-like acetyltransferase